MLREWFQRRRDRRARIVADAAVLIREHEAEAYEIALAREESARRDGGKGVAGHWRRVALQIAKVEDS